MRRRLGIGLCLLIGWYVIVSHTQENLLLNPSFENGLTHWTNTGTEGSVTASTEAVRTGSYAAKFASVTTAYTGRGVRSASVPVNPGELYTFGVYGYVVATASSPTAYWRFIQIEWRDAGAIIITSEPAAGTRFSQLGVWEETSLERTAPANAASATLLIRLRRDTGSVATDIYIDDAFIRGEDRCTLTVEIVGSGTVDVDGVPYTAPVTLRKGTALSLEAKPATGWTFRQWENGSPSPIRTIILNNDLTVTASFAQVFTVVLSADPAGGGTVTGGGAYASGTEITVLAAPYESYRFTAWTEGGAVVATHPAYTFVVAADRALVAQFTLCECPDCPPLVGSWREESSSPLAGGIGEAVVGARGAIYILRAHSTGPYQFWRYSPGDRTWTELSLPPERPKSGTSLVWDGGDSLYALLGAAYTPEDANRRFFYRYHMPSDTWAREPDTPSAQGAGSALARSGFDNRLYALLGSNYPAHGRGFARFDPGTGVWTTLSYNPLWEGTDDGAGLAWTGGEWIYALQGEWLEIIAVRGFARYHIPTGTWQQLPDVPDPGGLGNGGSLLWIGQSVPERASCVFVIGGNSVREAASYDFYIYNAAHSSWSQPQGQQLPCPVGSWSGNRLAFAEGRMWYWQGAPTTWDCGGSRLHSLQVSGTHTILATAGSGGTVAPSGAVVVPHEGSQVFTITPMSGHTVADVVVDGISVGPVATYTFSVVVSNHTIHAAFTALQTVTLTLAVVGRGRVSVDGTDYTGPVTVARGTELRLDAIAEPGSLFQGWEDGSGNPTRALRVFTDAAVTATFRTSADCVCVSPHPVPAEGAVFWLSLPPGAVGATLSVFAVDGARLARLDLDPSATRFPTAGRWEPRDDRGRLLGTGLYLVLVEVRHGDGAVSHCPIEKMVIQR